MPYRNSVSEILDIAPVLAVIVGENTQIYYANRMAEFEFKDRSKKILGKKLQLLFPKVERKRISEFISTGFILKQRSPHEVFQGFPKNHKPQPRFFEATSIPFKKGNKKYLLIILNNVSKAVRIISREEKEKLHAENLVNQLSDQKRQNELFLSIATHELKNPLTSIQAYVKLSEKRIDKPQELKKYLSKINYETKNLAKLINDLSDITKIRIGKLSIKKVSTDLDKMINQVIAEIQTTHITHKIIKKGKLRKKILIDPERIEQIFQNLLLNAIKYSPDKNEVIIGVKKIKKNVIVYVKDFGIGIPKKQQENIFKSFYQLKTNKIKEGLGLGLYIADAIVKEHNGKIWVESKPGLGSTFYFTLPL